MSKEQNSFAPGMSPETWKGRLELEDKVRAFFDQRAILRVETPVCSRYGASDPHINQFITEPADLQERRFLCTSPEYHMKRLLAAGYPDIWQQTKAFRSGECGERHNPEFTILEWYRKGMNWRDLALEVVDLLRALIPEVPQVGAKNFISFADSFLSFGLPDPFSATTSELLAAAEKHELHIPEQEEGMHAEDYHSMLLDFIFSILVCPNLGHDTPAIITHWPKDQAALAQTIIEQSGRVSALRFEIFWQGYELANGYQELTDSSEQASRFALDNENRKRMGLPTVSPDPRLLAALDSSFPNCSGVAVGLDRLVMLAMKKNTIDEVLLFADSRC